MNSNCCHNTSNLNNPSPNISSHLGPYPASTSQHKECFYFDDLPASARASRMAATHRRLAQGRWVRIHRYFMHLEFEGHLQGPGTADERASLLWKTSFGARPPWDPTGLAARQRPPTPSLGPLVQRGVQGPAGAPLGIGWLTRAAGPGRGPGRGGMERAPSAQGGSGRVMGKLCL